MRIGVISDPHANMPGLEAALAGCAREGCQEIWCLGDLVGRGPHPAEAIDLLMSKCAIVLNGNHDRVVCGRDPMKMIGWHEPLSRWTVDQIGERRIRLLADLESQDIYRDVYLVHGSPRQPAWEPVSDRATATICMAMMPVPLGLFGHTHVPATWREDRPGVLKGSEYPRELRLDRRAAFLNPGSTADHRDGSGLARWLMIDTGLTRVAFHAEPYDVGPVRDDLISAGFESMLRHLGFAAAGAAST